MENNDEIKQKIDTLFSFFGIDASQVVVTETDELISITLEVPEVEAGRFIGRYAATLDSLQLIISMMVNPAGGDLHKHVLVDVGGYRARRLETLTSMVDRVSSTVLATGEPAPFPHSLRPNAVKFISC